MKQSRLLSLTLFLAPLVGRADISSVRTAVQSGTVRVFTFEEVPSRGNPSQTLMVPLASTAEEGRQNQRDSMSHQRADKFCQRKGLDRSIRYELGYYANNNGTVFYRDPLHAYDSLSDTSGDYAAAKFAWSFAVQNVGFFTEISCIGALTSN